MAKKYNLSTEQFNAANPSENVWVQANAGTGKTSVLIQRLLRILFRSFNDDNFSKSGILCLTYTNAGASEMRNRILHQLRTWATASDDELKDLLSGITTENNICDSDISKARKIFYIYIDNPDILKIKTIHGFCEEILHRFPIEAGISPAWKLISDSNQKILLHDTFHDLIHYTTDQRVKDAFSYIVGRVSEYKFDELLGVLTEQYKRFFQIDNFDNYRKYFIDNTALFLNINNAPETNTSTKILLDLVKKAEFDVNSSKKPEKTLHNIINITKQYIDNAINFQEYIKPYITQNGNKNSKIPKLDYLIDEQERVYQLNQYNINKQIYSDTVALFDLSVAFAQNYKALKLQRNLMDFDDLILYTRKLFAKPDVMGWVLSQLDTQISHILVDEAQDTSPEQWDILKMLTGDFFINGETVGKNRSLFVVGDTKQSIYGFQGADPKAFSESRETISENIKQNLRSINEIPLTQSFRSANAILKTVDKFFNNEQIYNLTGFINNEHKCFRMDVNGLVEIHPIMSSKDEIDTENNTDL